jgi:MinD-like ATPase involved in chromosome partitioning or flagellar assembly
MATIVSIHSFRGGTGKSNTTANLATVLAGRGQRVAVIDTDIQSPGIHVLFGLAGEELPAALNDFLWRGRNIEDAAHDVTPEACRSAGGRIFLIPSSIKPGEITRVLREGYDAQRLTHGLRRLVTELHLDLLLIDTHPGLHEETLLSLVISHVLLVVLRPDQQDYEGTGVTVKVAQGLQVPRLLLVVNKMPPAFDAEAVRRKVEAAYGCQVAAVLPHADEMMQLASAGIFALRYPEHPMTAQYQQVAAALVA